MSIKTEKLLKGLEEENITIIDMDRFFQQQGVLVDVHVEKIGNNVTLPYKALGVDTSLDSEAVNNFSQKHVKSGKLSFLPDEQIGKLNKIEVRIRQKKAERAIGFDNRYMPLDVYREFKEEYKKEVDRYNNTIEEISSQWDILMNEFKSGLDFMLEERKALDKETIRRNILAKMPSKEQFENKCRMELELSAFPVQSNLDILDGEISEEMKESIEARSLKTINDILGNILSDAFDKINTTIKIYQEKNNLKKSQLDVLKKLETRIKKKNILKHPIINQIVDELKEMNKLSDLDELEEKCEDILILIYGFAKSVDIDMYLNLDDSILSEVELQTLSLGFKF